MLVILRLGLIALALVCAFVPVPSGLVERLYSDLGYPAWQRVITGLSNRVPFALFDLLALLVAARLVMLLFRAVRPGKAGWRHALLGSLLRISSLAAVVYLVFLFSWGLNYRRVPLTSRLDHAPARVTAAAARSLAEKMVAGANELHPQWQQRGWRTWDRVVTGLAPSFERVQTQLQHGYSATPGTPKWSVLTYYFERAGVDAMTDPFFLEVLVNQELLPFERPAALAHEWAHLAGYADEAEANLVGWLVCLQGPPSASYSAHLAILWQVVAGLEASERDKVLRHLAKGPRADLKAIAARLAGAHPVVRQAGWRVYDRYLKANRVEAGVGSYRAAVQLLLGTRLKPGWIPVVRDEGV